MTRRPTVRRLHKRNRPQDLSGYLVYICMALEDSYGRSQFREQAPKITSYLW